MISLHLLSSLLVLFPSFFSQKKKKMYHPLLSSLVLLLSFDEWDFFPLCEISFGEKLFVSREPTQLSPLRHSHFVTGLFCWERQEERELSLLEKKGKFQRKKKEWLNLLQHTRDTQRRNLGDNTHYSVIRKLYEAEEVGECNEMCVEFREPRTGLFFFF